MTNPELTLRLAYERHDQLIRDAANWNARHRAARAADSGAPRRLTGSAWEVEGPGWHAGPRPLPLTSGELVREERDPAA